MSSSSGQPGSGNVTILERPPLPESAIPRRTDYSHLLYARGFLLTDVPHKVPVDHWLQETIGRHVISYDPRLPILIASTGEVWVALLGKAVDLDSFVTEDSGLAHRLLSARLAGRCSFLPYLDGLAGRYIVLDGDGAQTFVQSDAASMRSISFATSTARPIVASHAALVADVTDSGQSVFADPRWWRREHNAYALPGRGTSFENVVFLTPNTELRLETMEVMRTFPRRPPERYSVNDVVEILIPQLRGQLDVLGHRNALTMSLTAGLDSRVSLAINPSDAPIELFSYRPLFGAREATDRDVAVASQLARIVNSKHRVVTVPRDLQIEPELLAVMVRNSQRESSRRVAAACLGELPVDRLHIRSNHYEIGRSFYRAQRARPEVLTPRTMALLLTKGRSAAKELVDAFDEFYYETHFDRLHGYDAYDLFYWEHRMGTWINAHLCESDVSHDTYTVVNARRIYAALLSVPVESRIRAEMLLEIIRRCGPRLLDIPVNGTLMR